MLGLSTITNKLEKRHSSSGGDFDVALVEHFAERQHVGAIATIVVAFAITAVIWDHVPSAISITWMAAQTIVALLSIVRWNRFRHIGDAVVNTRALLTEAVAWKAASGALWGLLAVFSFLYLPPSLEFFAAIATAAMAVGSISTLAAIPAAVYVFLTLSFAPFVMIWFISDDAAYSTLGFLTILLFGVMINSARIAHAQLKSILQAEFDNLQLNKEFNDARDAWSDLTDNTEAYVVFDQEERLLSWNQRFAELRKIPDELLRCGTPRAELIKHGRQPVEVVNGSISAEQWLQQRMDRTIIESDAANVTEFEGGVWIQRRARYSKNGQLVVSHIDLTEHVTMERALSESEERSQLIAENSPDPIFVRVEEEIVYTNPAAVRMLRAQSQADLLGTKLISLVHPGDRQLTLDNWVKTAQGSDEHPAFIRSRMRRLDGTYVMTEGSETLHTWKSQPAVLIAQRDITAQMEAEERLQES
jgi:PAS domain S-box-containing protein